jgi:hypothetical protein
MTSGFVLILLLLLLLLLLQVYVHTSNVLEGLQTSALLRVT